MTQTPEMLSVDRRARVKLPGIPKPYHPPEERIAHFGEASPGYTAEQAKTEAARCIHCKDPAPCVRACPFGNDIPSALWHIEHGDFQKAIAIFRQTSTMPEICGRVCPPEHTCAGHCVLGKQNNSIHIGTLEFFVADQQRHDAGVPLPEKAPPTGKRVGIVGAGPAGLSCAERLVIAGHEAVVYDTWPEPGGLLMYGVPDFKLDRAIIRWKADWLARLGVTFRCGTKVGEDMPLDDLIARERFDAVFLGTGALIEATMGVPGENLPGVYLAIDFLVRHNTPKDALPAAYHAPVEVGERVAVIGGGDTALDCLRTAIRLGARDVVCYYRRTEAEMPANADDHKLAAQEGARFEYLTAPVAFLDENGDGRVDAVRMIRMALGEPDASGRPRPVPVEGSEYQIEVDSVMLAIGFWPDPLLGETTPDLETQRHGLIVADPATGQTSRPEIFAGGDAVTGPDLVVSAAAAGIRAANAINDFLTR